MTEDMQSNIHYFTQIIRVFGPKRKRDFANLISDDNSCSDCSARISLFLAVIYKACNFAAEVLAVHNHIYKAML
jgi:hypothetical protein